MTKNAAIFLLALFHPFFLRAADAPGDVRELHPIWEERFRDRPIVRLADDRTLTDTWLLSGIDGNSSIRPMATVMRWRPEWVILYVPKISRAYDPADLMRGIKTGEEE